MRSIKWKAIALGGLALAKSGKRRKCAMKRLITYSRLLGIVIILLLPASGFPQNLSKVYVASSGNVLGAILAANPGYPASLLVDGTGLLGWIDLQLPNALIEIYPDGYMRVIELGGAANLSYNDGRIQKINDLLFQYVSGRVVQIGSMRLDYNTGQLRKIGDLIFSSDSNGQIQKIGSLALECQNGRILKIGSLPFSYDGNGRIAQIGNVQFKYEMGNLESMTGSNPGISITVSSTMEFRRRILHQ